MAPARIPSSCRCSGRRRHHRLRWRRAHREGRGIGTALVARALQILCDHDAGACHIGQAVREFFCTRRDTGRGGATGCSARPRAVTRRRLLPVRNDLHDGQPHKSSSGQRPRAGRKARRRHLLGERTVPPICAASDPYAIITRGAQIRSIWRYGLWRDGSESTGHAESSARTYKMVVLACACSCVIDGDQRPGRRDRSAIPGSPHGMSDEARSMPIRRSRLTYGRTMLASRRLSRSGAPFPCLAPG
jgi:hypothetical protein